MHHDFKSELKDAWHIALLKKHVMHHVADDHNKTVFGYYIIIAAALLGAIGQQIFGYGFFKPSLTSSLLMAVVQVISTVIGIYVISFVAKSIFKGHAKHDAFFRVAAYGMIITWISLIPQLSIIGGIWGLVLFFVILKTIHKLTTGGVIGTFIVSFIIMMVVSMLLSPIYGLIGFGGMKGSFDMKSFGGRSFDVKTEEGDARVDYDEGDMKITTEEGEAAIEFDGGTMKITGPDGKVMEINIPN